jgi:hypothetical protein
MEKLSIYGADSRITFSICVKDSKDLDKVRRNLVNWTSFKSCGQKWTKTLGRFYAMYAIDDHLD